MLSCLEKIKRENGQRPDHVPYAIDTTLLVDRSGSMLSMGKSVVKGVKEFIESQKTNKCKQSKITIVGFDDIKEILSGFDNCNIIECPEIQENDFKPRGMTRLIDTAMEEAINQQKRRDEWYTKLPNKIKILNPEYKCIFAILTDGQDNKSTKYQASDMKKYLNKMQKSKKVIPYFLGANQDAVNTGDSYGFHADNSLTYSSQPNTALNAIRSLSNGISRASSGNQYVGFSQLHRQLSCDAGNQQTTSILPRIPQKDIYDDLNTSRNIMKRNNQNFSPFIPTPPTILHQQKESNIRIRKSVRIKEKQ